MKRWYVVHAQANYENQVRAALQERVERFGLTERFGEILVPAEEIVEMRNGQKRKTQRKFFPGYVLVQIETMQEDHRLSIDNDSWHLVKQTPKVMGFIGGTSIHPLPIKDSEADRILARIQVSAEKPQPKVLFETGQFVRITEGPFKDFDGTVEEINYDKNKAKVGVLIFGRSTSIDIDFSSIEKQAK